MTDILSKLTALCANSVAVVSVDRATLEAAKMRIEELEAANRQLDFWRDLIVKDGALDIEQVKKELADYEMLLEFVPKVYCELTGYQISKPNTLPDVVVAVANDYFDKIYKEQREEIDKECGEWRSRAEAAEAELARLREIKQEKE